MVIDRSENIGVSLPSRFTPVEVVYYDDYAFLDSLSTEERQKYLPQDIAGADEAEPMLMGVPTGGKRALSNGSDKMLLYVNYYDRLGRVVQTCEDNILGKVDYNGTTYSFIGMPVTAEKLFNHSSSSVSHLVYTNTYDALDRNLMTTLSVNESAAQLLQTNTYDSLGRLQNAAMGNNAASVSYGYNLRGWATGIMSNQFSQQIYYQDTTGGSTPCFNGNISSMAWMQSGANGNSSKSGRYNYTYDSLDRLTAAAFADNDSRSFSSQYQYDLHGNVTNIQRSGVAERITDGAAETVTYGVIDNVTLSYSGNRLQVADDAADALVYDGAMDFTDGANEVEEYAYDANGNMTMDLNRGIESITYDWNNMPREITFTSGAKTRYTYDAAGRKLRAEYITPLAASANYATRPTPPRPPELPILPPGPPSPPVTISTVCYHGDCVLRDDSLERVLTPNGYIASDTLHYYIKDYQGNVRSVVRHDGAVVESNEYYPYGGLFAATASVQPYKYGAKELDRTHGLDLYDSEARWYDSLLGRTSTMDPKSEKYYDLSPYLWCAGNPVRFVDQYGMSVDKAFEFFSRSINYSVSIGAQLGFNINSGKKSISFDINFRSIDLYNSEGNNKISESINIGCYGFSFSAEKAVWEETDDIAIVESTTAIDFYGLGVNIESTQTASKVAPDLWRLNSDRNSEVNPYYSFPIDTFITADFHCLIGLELKFNISDLWNGLKELFSK